MAKLPSAKAGYIIAALFALLSIGLAMLLAVPGVADDLQYNRLGRLELDVHSELSHIRLRRYNNVRSLIFVRNSGEEALESQVDLQRPYELRLTYLQHLFLSHAVKPEINKVLIIGLGGGSMIHFLQKYDPEVKIDAVELDPEVVKIADKYFGVRDNDNVHIITADGFKYIAETEEKYDVIYMDAFLKPSEETDSTGAPLHLKTKRFYEQLQSRLTADGIVAFNINPHRQIREDVQVIQESFPQIYDFNLPGNAGKVVLGSMAGNRLSLTDLAKNSRKLDDSWRTSFSFQRMLRGYVSH